MKKIFDKVKTCESGQMLLFVLVVVMLLLIIVLAIVVNIKTDMQAVQQEQNYEKGYAEAEDTLLAITSSSLDNWKKDTDAVYCWDDLNPIPTEISEYSSILNKFCNTSGPNADLNMDECCLQMGLGDDETGMVLVKNKLWREIHDMSIDRDETIEVDLTNASGTLDVRWAGAPAMSAMLVCERVSGDYYSIRMAICRSGSDVCDPTVGTTGFENISDAQGSGPFNTDLCRSDGGAPILLRLRAIGEAATNIYVTGNLPLQMNEVRVQSFPAGLELAEDVPAPELHTLAMIHKRLPSLFDYVLFVADGDVDK